MNTPVKVSPRDRLSAERLRRHWSQLEVADQLGTTPGNVSRWERGITSPGPYFRHKLCELFGKSAQELGLTWDASDESHDYREPVSSSIVASSPGNVSSQNTSGFGDWEDLLTQIQSLHRPDLTMFSGLRAGSERGEPNLPEQERTDSGGLMQAITRWLQAHQNVVLIVDNPEAVVIVAPKENGC
jgi:transcriptional regulator with XRE-family HTH domain